MGRLGGRSRKGSFRVRRVAGAGRPPGSKPRRNGPRSGGASQVRLTDGQVGVPSVRQAHSACDRHVKPASLSKVLRREAVALDAPATLRRRGRARGRCFLCVEARGAPAVMTSPVWGAERGTTMNDRHINSVQWEQAIGWARAHCARIFRDGGSPAAALGAFGLSVPDGARLEHRHRPHRARFVRPAARAGPPEAPRLQRLRGQARGDVDRFRDRCS